MCVLMGLSLAGPCGIGVVTSVDLVFFFFQAEDGIRDSSVTGVQTCALPICSRKRSLCKVPSREKSACRIPVFAGHSRAASTPPPSVRVLPEPSTHPASKRGPGFPCSVPVLLSEVAPACSGSIAREGQRRFRKFLAEERTTSSKTAPWEQRLT